MSSDSSSCYETTYSEDERYEEYRKEKKRQEIEEARQLELEREQNFKNLYATNKDKARSIFKLSGVDFIRYTHKRIKFSFQPCRVVEMVSQRVMFFVSLRHRKGRWLLRHDSIPANYKLRVYSLFYTNGSFSLTDENVNRGIVEIWKILRIWAEKEADFRIRKYEKYCSGEDVYLDRDDEDLFLSDSETEELHRKREAVWARMLPPTATTPVRRRRRRRRRVSPSLRTP